MSSHRKKNKHRIKGRGLLGSDGLDKIRITGGKPLQGTISIQGSKNSALPMMAASLLHRGVSVLKGCPAIADVYCMEDILRSWVLLPGGKKIPFILTAAERTEQKFPETVPEKCDHR